MGNLGMGEILIIAAVALLLFGPRRIPEIAKALGKTVNAFKSGLRETYNGDEPPAPKAAPGPAADKAAAEKPAGEEVKKPS